MLQIIEAARKVTGQAIPYSVEGRRPGDPAALVASAGKARREPGWQRIRALQVHPELLGCRRA